MCLLRNLLNLLALSCSNTLNYSFNICRICSDFSFILIICLFLPALATHSSTLAWKIPWVEEPGSLQSMGSQRVTHDWSTSLSLSTFMNWRRKWQPTPVFLPGESQGWGSLVGCRLWGRTESDTLKGLSSIGLLILIPWKSYCSVSCCFYIFCFIDLPSDIYYILSSAYFMFHFSF